MSVINYNRAHSQFLMFSSFFFQRAELTLSTPVPAVIPSSFMLELHSKIQFFKEVLMSFFIYLQEEFQKWKGHQLSVQPRSSDEP